MRALSTQSFRSRGLKLLLFVPEEGFKLMKVGEKALREKKTPPVEI
jgi:hypothetical protein